MSTQTQTRHISKTDTAKLVRQALKREWPAITFGVTSGRGSVIQVRWTDGPSTRMVERVTGKYSGADFDGMIDLKSYHDSTLNGERVHFGADWVSCSRSYSERLYRAVGERIAREYGTTMPAEMTAQNGMEGPVLNPHGHYDQTLRDFLWRELQDIAVSATGEAVRVTLKELPAAD